MVRRPRFRNAFALVSICLSFCFTLCTTGCGSENGGVCEGDIREAPKAYNPEAPKVYNGTLVPTFVPLDDNQILAIGDFNGCSGTLIAPTWVLTATHCQLSVDKNTEFCMGPEPNAADTCITAKRIVSHPVVEVDMTLVELSEDARTRLPGVQPISIMTEVMDDSWINRTAEAAGYGQTEDDTLGTRYFSAEPIVALSDTYVTVDGEGTRGLCFGDSGGPVMVVAPDNTVRVAGALSTGDTTCMGKDHFSRTDLQQLWIESYTGPTVVGEPGCGLLDFKGRCDTDMALWCEADQLRTDICPSGATCGWDEQTSAFRCITDSDPCQGFDRRGGCDGDVARWCENGEPKSRDCGNCDESCNPFATLAGAYCLTDPCMGLDYRGECDGDVARWCDNGEILRRDCAAMGQSCGFINDDTGYYCM